MTTYLTMNKLSHRLSEQLFKTSRNSTQQCLCHHMNNIPITTPMAIHSLILGCFPCMAPFHHITIRVTSRHCQHIPHLAVRLHHHPPVLHHPHPKQKTSNGGISSVKLISVILSKWIFIIFILWVYRVSITYFLQCTSD